MVAAVRNVTHSAPKLFKGNKAIPLTGLGDLQGCEMLRLVLFLDSRLTCGGVRANLMRRLSLTQLEYSCYSFL
jgi:hypothetical protein